MTNFHKRSITAIAYAALFVGSAFAGEWAFAAFLLLLNVLALLEFYRIIGKSVNKPQTVTGTLSGIYLFISLFLVQVQGYSLRMLLPLFGFFALTFIIELYRKKATPFQNIGLTFLGVIYVSLPLALFPAIATVFYIYEAWLVVSILVLIWANDTGAYLIGSKIGKTPLSPVSPKKTIEGTIGGALTVMIIAYLLSMWIDLLHPLEFMLLGILAVVGATFGDLSESQLKRSLDIKDSGTILPGHGGILDRIDALLLVLPVIYGFLYMIR